MSAVLPFLKTDSDSFLARYFTSYQIAWIQAEDPFHNAGRRVFALAEKSVRIGWTFADGFKNVRKRLRFPQRDYLFATRDWPSALEYMKQAYDFAELLGFTRAVLVHGEDFVKVNALDPEGHPTSLTEEVKIGYIKFQNGSRIIAFSSNPYAMAVYGGDVGLDEFAKHPNAQLLWQTAQARVTWNKDLAVWSSHDGEDKLFNQFAQQARAATSSPVGTPSSASPSNSAGVLAVSSADFQSAVSQASSLLAPVTPSALTDPSSSAVPIENQKSKIENTNPWNLYFRVTMPDAVELGLVDVINRTTGSHFTPKEFLADCRARSGSEEIYQQSYLCNPLGAATAAIVEWSAIERCRADYSIDRLHLEGDEIIARFGQFDASAEPHRRQLIHDSLRSSFPSLFAIENQKSQIKNPRLGFDVAASGQGDLACIYIDEAKGSELWLRALFTCRTEDWHFLKTVLYFYLDQLPGLLAAGDESGLGRQICWEAAEHFSGRFSKVNLASKKHDLGFALMNQLSVSEKRFPRSEYDIAADFFALRKSHTGTRWVFSEGRNTSNLASHCDIAWAAALSSFAHAHRPAQVGAAVLYETGWFDGKDFHPYKNPEYNEPASPKPGQRYALGCGFCQHRPPHFNPPPARCTNCGIYKGAA